MLSLPAHGLASKWPDEAKSAPQAKKNGVFACILVGVDELLLATPHSNLGQSLCTCLVGWYPPSRGDRKQLLLGTPHLGGQGGGGSK